MRIFTNKVGAPTIVSITIVILLSFIMLPGVFDFSRKAGMGNSFYESVRGYGDVQNIPVEIFQKAKERAMQDGMKHGVFMVLGQHIPATVLILITIGLISKSTTVEFKRMIRKLYIVTCVIGIFFLSLGASYSGQGLPFPSSLGPSTVIYIGVSVVLWTIIGTSFLIRGKWKTYCNMSNTQRQESVTLH